MRKRPFIYVCSPLRGDIEGNIGKAIRYCRFVYTKGSIPLAPHVIFTTFLDNNIPEERKVGIEMGLDLLLKCNELWAFGKRISEEMAEKIKMAEALGLKIKRFNERCEPLEVVDGEFKS
ncbi:DUF4406 domain-containing protein [Caloranaerobacter ferrireducens]|uniref:DUF7768 domain-containing protein n=1 Tax=Caloranaerobacter ferrireducens TaxID=1323370 RepID=UPI00084D5791|nr:DUF4406 domain-containing protein [Caloranaerobacter ferrireducens]